MFNKRINKRRSGGNKQTDSSKQVERRNRSKVKVVGGVGDFEYQ